MDRSKSHGVHGSHSERDPTLVPRTSLTQREGGGPPCRRRLLSGPLLEYSATGARRYRRVRGRRDLGRNRSSPISAHPPPACRERPAIRARRRRSAAGTIFAAATAGLARRTHAGPSRLLL